MSIYITDMEDNEKILADNISMGLDTESDENYIREVCEEILDNLEYVIVEPHYKSNSDANCPICSGSLSYCFSEIGDSDDAIYSWTCDDCGATGNSFYKLVFDTHGSVKTKEGVEVKNKEGY